MIIDFNTPITIVEEDFKAIKPSCLHACYLFMEVTINWRSKSNSTIKDRENRKKELPYIFTTKEFMRNISAEKLFF